MYVYIYIYIYIYIERERERDVYIYIYIFLLEARADRARPGERRAHHNDDGKLEVIIETSESNKEVNGNIEVIIT